MENWFRNTAVDTGTDDRTDNNPVALTVVGASPRIRRSSCEHWFERANVSWRFS